MKRHCRLAAALLCCSMAIGMSGCGTGARKEQSLPQIGQEQQLVLYTSYPEEAYLPFVQEFEDRTGIWVKVETGGSQELLERIAAEEDAPQADVILGGGVDSMQAYRSFFASYRSDETESAEQGTFEDQDRRWVCFAVSPLVILYNTKLVSAGDAPVSWSGLLDDRWLGHIAFASPQVTGVCYTALSTAEQLYGEEYLEEFIKSLSGLLLTNSDEIASAVAEGDFIVGVTTESCALQAIAEGADLAYSYPEDGTSAVPDGAAILKGAPHEENAELFLDFLLSQDAQAYLSVALSLRPVRSGVSVVSLPALEDIAVIDYDMEWAASERVPILEMWNSGFFTGGVNES